MKNLSILVKGIFLSFFLVFAGCDNSDDEAPDPGVAPEIPPITTFLMNFDITDADGGRQATMNNWSYSALNVGFWNITIGVTFAVPVASFAESFNHEPVYDASIPGWAWEYDYAALGGRYIARLEAELSSTTVQWNMYVTREGQFEDFNWYSGTSALDGLSGSWLLNKEPNDPSPFIEIQWVRSMDGISNIGYTNVVPDADTNGDFIFFQISDDVDFNREYDIYDKSEDNLTEIQWHSENKDGRVRDFAHFQDIDFHCWDGMLDDIVCP